MLRECGPLAQRLEQRTHNPLVVGSNPTGPTKSPLSGPDSPGSEAAAARSFSSSIPSKSQLPPSQPHG